MDGDQLGKYRILDKIGTGGFATVYRALDTTLDREVALKVLDPLLARDPGWKARFQREAKAVARLRHSHIVTIWEIGESEGRLFIAMELVDGPSLAGAIQKQGRFPFEDALKLLKEVADALDYAHSQGILHRDLKPANILLDAQRGAVLTDFGFARLVGESSVSTTVSGGIVGTPAYIAPEVWDGKEPTGQTDLYSLACVAYEMLTGKVLFQGPTPSAVMKQHFNDDLRFEPSPALPAAAAAVLRRGLARVPGERHPSGQALVTALAASAQPASTQISQSPPPKPGKRPRKIVPLLLGGGVLVVVLAVAFVIPLQPPQGARSPAAAPPTALSTQTAAAPTSTVTQPQIASPAPAPTDAIAPPLTPVDTPTRRVKVTIAPTDTVVPTSTTRLAPTATRRPLSPTNRPAPSASLPSGQVGLILTQLDLPQEIIYPAVRVNPSGWRTFDSSYPQEFRFDQVQFRADERYLVDLYAVGGPYEAPKYRCSLLLKEPEIVKPAGTVWDPGCGFVFSPYGGSSNFKLVVAIVRVTGGKPAVLLSQRTYADFTWSER